MVEFPRIAVLDNDIEAGLLDTLLDEREIPHLIRSYWDSAYDGMFQRQRGWGCVLAPEECREVVLEILAEIRQGAELPGEPD